MEQSLGDPTEHEGKHDSEMWQCMFILTVASFFSFITKVMASTKAKLCTLAPLPFKLCETF